MSEILDNICIWVFLVNIESVLFLALVRYMLCSHFTQNCILLHFLEANNSYFVMKNCWKLIFVYLFCQKNGAIDFTKTLITQEQLVVESCPTPRWMAFLMLYRLVYNICSNFNELLILAWSTYLLYLVVKIRQLLNELSSLPEVLYKRGDLKNFSNSQINTRSNHPEVFWQKMLLKILQNSQINIFA